jgi:type IV pilus assembly protein PilA
MNQLRLRNESGFTLIELLVVVAIIGILAAIAIPQFAAYRKRGYDSQVKTDLRNAATAQEAYFTQANAYKSGPLSSGTPLGFNNTSTVGISATGVTAGGFVLDASATAGCAGGTGHFTLDSNSGSIAGTNCN